MNWLNATGSRATGAVAIIFNNGPRPIDIRLPQLFDSREWGIEFYSGTQSLLFDGNGATQIEEKTIACVSWRT